MLAPRVSDLLLDLANSLEINQKMFDETWTSGNDTAEDFNQHDSEPCALCGDDHECPMYDIDDGF